MAGISVNTTWMLCMLSSHLSAWRRKCATDYSSLSSSSTSSSSAEYRQESSDEASRFHTSLLGLRDTLDKLGRDKGLANYNHKDQIETILKDFTNANKNFLDSMDRIIEGVPGIGPVLGPSMFFR